MKCFFCQLEFEGRADAKFCSASCRVKFGRNSSKIKTSVKVGISKNPYITLTPEQVQEADDRFAMSGSVISAYKNYLKFKEQNPEDTFLPNWMREYLYPTKAYG